MRPTTRLAIAVGTPVVLAVLLVSTVFLRSIAGEREMSSRDEAHTTAVVEERLRGVISDLGASATALVGSDVVRRAVEDADVASLSELGALFHRRTVSTVVFWSVDGTPIARSDDASRRADGADRVVPRLPDAFSPPVQGFVRLDDDVFLADVRPVRSSSETNVGTVFVGVWVNRSLLRYLVSDTDAGMELRVGAQTYVVGADPETARRRVPLTVPVSGGGPDGGLLPADSSVYAELIFHDGSADNGVNGLPPRVSPVFLSIATTAIVVIVSLATVWVVMRSLRPYGRLLDALSVLAREELSSDEMSTTAPSRESPPRRTPPRRTPPREAPTDRQASIRLLAAVSGTGQEAAGIARAVTRIVERASENERELMRVSSTDHLTGLNNRWRLESILHAEVDRSSRYGVSFAVIMADIDHFRVINDTFGRASGDQVLRRTARVIAADSRRSDVMGRWGGESFLLICPHVELAGALTVAEKLRKAVRHAELTPGPVPPSVSPVGTVSIGVAVWSEGDTTASLLRRADAALRRAKEDGRDRVAFGRS